MDSASAIFERALADLEGRMGVKRADLTAADLFALVRACERVANPFDGVNASLVGRPVRVCDGVYLHALTIGALVWLEQTADVWWADDPRMYREALVYALVNARRPEAFRERGLRETAAAVRASMRAIGATSAELDDAIDRAVGRPSGTSSAKDEIARTAQNWAELVAKVEARTGLPRERWLWGESYAQTLRVYRHLLDVAKSTCDARAKDELDDAMNELQTLKVAIMKRVNHG